MANFAELPKDLPAPLDDGACNHLLNQALPSIVLSSTQGRDADLSAIVGRVVIYCYPMTGKPSISLPEEWDQIPGARGCTPQSCAFRDHYQELERLNTQVYGLSTQSTEYQQEAVERLHLPFELLSDAELNFATSLKLPIFKVEGQQLIKRLTLIAEAGKIIKVFYPVFPPDRNADDVVATMQQRHLLTVSQDQMNSIAHGYKTQRRFSASVNSSW
jgi:peroxiredoxin